MDALTYRIIHLIGLAALAIGTGGMLAGDKNRRTFANVQGIALAVILISGFGMLARMHLGFPHFAMAKLAIWLVIGMLPLILRKLNIPLVAGILITLTLVGLAAWLGVMKPALW